MGYRTKDPIAQFSGMKHRFVHFICGLKDGCTLSNQENRTPGTATGGTAQHQALPAEPPLLHTGWTRISQWSGSSAKRAFDCFCVLLFLPIVTPLMAVVALAVRLTSRGPVLFIQQRMGRHGRPFLILKFRTMAHTTGRKRHVITTAVNQRFTSIGPFLRRWKLDELPQLFNVLAGHMSLVGPRPKLPEQVLADLPCRPGITGAATIAFAREEKMLAEIPQRQLDDYYYRLVLPAKGYLDAAYMARATFLSDLELIARTLLRRWDDSLVRDLLTSENLLKHGATRHSPAHAGPAHADASVFAVAGNGDSEGLSSF